MSLPPLASADLAPFATHVRAEGNKFTTIPEVLEPGDVPGQHAFAVLCPQPVDPKAISITFLERHPHSTQTFVPLKVGRWLVLLAPTLSDGTPDLANIRAFLAGPEDAICIHRNVWHAGLTVLDRPAEVGMMMWRSAAGPADDGIVYELKAPIVLSV
ncbi:ureidoglycolate lyase [Devosia sp. A16]|uniref:ureidoglycolate lyase n=1 Tax=Devosia sp. A16 TaxID=1736675 RepID=UPI0006D83EF0|nr:ureidoglycolate lyase [Devosia sp. A16]